MPANTFVDNNNQKKIIDKSKEKISEKQTNLQVVHAIQQGRHQHKVCIKHLK